MPLNRGKRRQTPSTILVLCREIGLIFLCLIFLLYYYFQTEFGINSMIQYSQEKGCISHKNRLIYVHIPKTGGTTIERTPMFDDARKFHRVGGHYIISTMISGSKSQNYIKAATIRHPCERFISAFKYLTSGKGNKGDRKWAENNIRNMTIDEYLINQNSMKFPDFDWIHFQRQYKYIFHKRVCEVNTILCQEQWDEGINRLFRKIGQSVPDYLLSSTSANEKNDERGHALKVHHESCAELKVETREILERYYAMDYCLFEYQSLPIQPNKGICIGKSKSQQDFTERYALCMTMVDNQK